MDPTPNQVNPPASNSEHPPADPGHLPPEPMVPVPVPRNNVAAWLKVNGWKLVIMIAIAAFVCWKFYWQDVLLAFIGLSGIIFLHELGHFLMEWHELSALTGFQCRSEDMRETREDRQHHRQEAQANRFAINLLAPWTYVDQHLSRTPDLQDAERIRSALQISLEAAVRRMIARRDERLAAVVSKDGRVRYTVRGGSFPWVALTERDALPRISAARQAVSSGNMGFTEMVEAMPGPWTGRTDIDLWEQTRVGRNGTAITLLEAEMLEADGEDDDGGLAELGPPGFR